MPNHGTSVSSRRMNHGRKSPPSSDVLGPRPRVPAMWLARPRQRGGHEETHGTVPARERWAWAQQGTRANKTQVSGGTGGGCGFAGHETPCHTEDPTRRKVKAAGHRTALAANRKRTRKLGAAGYGAKGRLGGEAGFTEPENYCQEVLLTAQ